ncbi:MAG TPA: M15 family metallopeptidase [Armatimonadota bacterium]
MELFVEVAGIAPGIVVDLPYARNANAFGAAMYPLNRAFLRSKTAGRLARAQRLLCSTGLRLKVWDAYRPLSVQRAMWDALPDEDFVAPPGRGSRHNRGAAVDVTLVGPLDAEVEMPSGFDDFSERAHVGYAGGSREARANRDLLRAVMLAAGFTGIDEEWWHFDDPEYRRWPLCDVSLHQLAAHADWMRRCP